MSQSLFYRILAIILCSFVPALGLVGVQVYDVYRADHERAADGALSRAEMMAHHYGQVITDARALLTVVGSDPAVVGESAKSCDTRLQEVLAAQPIFTMITRVDRAGRIRCSAGSLAGKAAVMLGPAITEAVSTKRFLITRYHEGQAPDPPTVTLMLPIPGTGGAQDVLAAGLRVPSLRDELNDAHLPPQTRAMIIGGNQVVLAEYPAPKGDLAADPLEAEFAPLIDRAAGAAADIVALGSHKVLFAHAPIGPVGSEMILAISEPAEIAHIISRRLIRSTAVVIAATAMFILFGTWIGYAVLVARWVDALALAARRLRMGARDARAGPPYGPGELGELAQAFDAMADALNGRELLIADARQRLVDAIESITEGFVLCDDRDRIVLVNSRFREIYPVSADALRPEMTFREMIEEAIQNGDKHAPSLERDEVLERRLAYRADPIGRLEDWSGQGRCIQVSDRKTPDGWTVTIYSDVTEQKTAERELANRVSELEVIRISLDRAKEEAEAALRARSQFLANTSHELRTPLNAIIGFSDLLKQQIFGPIGDDRYVGYARDILQSGSHLLKIINDLLDMSKIEAGKMTLHEEPVALEKLIAQCMRLVEGAAGDQHVELVSELPTALPMICVDELKLKQALINIVANAVKFTGWGGVVTLSACVSPNGELHMIVKDTGIGMSAEDIHVALEPFRQIDSSLTRRFDGTGLGLPLAEELLKLHGGRLEIDSRIGAGTTVRLILPGDRVLAQHAA